MDRDAPIGVFDSGLGGLTVARAIAERLPNEHLVYLGDTARVPYGTRSPHTVVRYARSCARHLAKHDIKLLVVACNTVSAVALPMLRVELDVPVLGVIEPGARAGARASRTGKLGVIATAGTVASGAYPQAIASVSTRVEVRQLPAPLLVPLVEEGWLEGEVPTLVVRRYLEPLVAEGIDALVLGCTHYPLLAPIIREEAARLAARDITARDITARDITARDSAARDSAARDITVVDSADATATELAELLADRDLARAAGPGDLSLMVTDLPGRFAEVAARFLGRDVSGLPVSAIDL